MWIVLVLCVAIFSSFGSSTTAVKKEQRYFTHPKDGHRNVSPHIIGGVEVTPHSYPFQTALFIYKGSESFICGGTLISNRWVLTAAHCLDMTPELVVIILGGHDLMVIETPMEIKHSIEYVVHEDWDEKTFKNDVGLVKLPESVSFNKYIQSVKLANGTDRYVDHKGTILGWGHNSSVLGLVNSTILSNDDCANTNGIYKEVIQPTHICASGLGKVGSCRGDSGGPLLVNGVQVGIVSFGTRGCEPGLPSVFTRVTHFHEWIVRNAVGGATKPVSLRLLAIVLAALCSQSFLE